MGGKTKHVQRTKNNAKPSSSARSAELLGNSTPAFVGFSVHSDLGLVPMVPGFALTEHVAEACEGVICSELQVILRKLSKKDPTTKKKALQELIDHIKAKERDELNSLLPVWPSYYQKLAIDPDHTVRETAQETLKLLMEKCNRNMAPYLKQIVPTWVLSRFDTYLQAAVVSKSSFETTFARDERRFEVLEHCQREILEFCKLNLTFHTPDTLSMGKNLAPEDAEQKYQRLVLGSLKSLSFFVKSTRATSEPTKFFNNLHDLIVNPKFIPFGKSKFPAIKGAWFELVENLLMTPGIFDLLGELRQTLVTVTVQNISEQDALVAPHVWSCLLQFQANDVNWYKSVDVRKSLLTKLSPILRNLHKKSNTLLICRNLLPFISHITPECLADMSVCEFDKHFFDDIMEAIKQADNDSYDKYVNLISAYFECLRYRFAKLYGSHMRHSELHANWAKDLLTNNVLIPIVWFLNQEENDKNILAVLESYQESKHRVYFRHTSDLVGFWSDRRDATKHYDLYGILLELFWKRIFEIIGDCIARTNYDNMSFFRRMVELVQCLYQRQPSKTNKPCSNVSFSNALEQASTSFSASSSSNADGNGVTCIRSTLVPANISQELKRIAVRLVSLCFCQIMNSPHFAMSYIKELENLTTIFCDEEFYMLLAGDDDLITTCKRFGEVLKFLSNIKSNAVSDSDNESHSENDSTSSSNTSEFDNDYNSDKENNIKKLNIDVQESAVDTLLDIIFNILKLVDKEKSYTYIEENLLVIPNDDITAMLMKRLLSYPYCMDAELRRLLQSPIAIKILYQIASDAVYHMDIDKLKIVEKCFFQDDKGDILIRTSTVDHLLYTLSDPLVQPESTITDACASFIAQITSLICASDICSTDVKYDIFVKLFRFTVERSCCDDVSDDIHIEVATAWQDFLCSGDIIADAKFLKECADIVHRKPFQIIYVAEQLLQEVNCIGDTIAKFVLSLTEQYLLVNEPDMAKYLQAVDDTFKPFFNGDELQQQSVILAEQHSVLLESLKSIITPVISLQNAVTIALRIKPIFQRTLVNITAIVKMILGDSLRGDDEIERKQERIRQNLSDSYDNATCDIDINLNSEKILAEISDNLYEQIIYCLKIAAIGETLLENVDNEFLRGLDIYVYGVTERIMQILQKKNAISHGLMLRMLHKISQKPDECTSRALLYLLKSKEFIIHKENANLIFLESIRDYLLPKGAIIAYTHCLQYLVPQMEHHTLGILTDMHEINPPELWTNSVIWRCYLTNLTLGNYMNKGDKVQLIAVLDFLKDMHKQHLQSNAKPLCSNVDLRTQDFTTVMGAVEYINLSTLCLYQIPYLLEVDNWDAISVGVGAWVLTISQSLENYTDPKILLFIVAVYKIYAALGKFIRKQEHLSSTALLTNIIDEWKRCFSKEVNIILYRSFYRICFNEAETSALNNMLWHVTLLELTPTVECFDFKTIYESMLQQGEAEVTEQIDFWLSNLHNCMKSVALTSSYIMAQLIPYFVEIDRVHMSQSFNTQSIEDNIQNQQEHFLMRFQQHLESFQEPINKYLEEFSFKLTEISHFKEINKVDAWAYLLLCDLIIDACTKAPIFLRTIYIEWLLKFKWIEKFLHFLFRAMPADILKNYDSKIFMTDMFTTLTWDQIKADDMTIEKYTCHLYMKVLRKLPASVRKWWNTSTSRQITFVDKFTQNYVSTHICNAELRAVANLKEKQENMQVNVHMSTREVLAIYSIDEVRMELVITLDNNYPLGSMKVECGRNIGGRALSRNIAKQLTVFLTHQNGTIFDGLCMWKDNLDKKFAGVEECFICYMVIHQDTCQLPKLTCKTCRKKFHGPCLYKWFTTSSKSTCPMCRNIF